MSILLGIICLPGARGRHLRGRECPRVRCWPSRAAGQCAAARTRNWRKGEAGRRHHGAVCSDPGLGGTSFHRFSAWTFLFDMTRNAGRSLLAANMRSASRRGVCIPAAFLQQGHGRAGGALKKSLDSGTILQGLRHPEPRLRRNQLREISRRWYPDPRRFYVQNVTVATLISCHAGGCRKPGCGSLRDRYRLAVTQVSVNHGWVPPGVAPTNLTYRG